MNCKHDKCPSRLICLARGENPWAAFVCEECKHMILVIEAGHDSLVEHHVSKISDMILCDPSDFYEEPVEVDGVQFGEVCSLCLWKRKDEEA